MASIINTAELQTLSLHQADHTFDPTEIRLSEVGQCSRRQTLRILGYPPEPPTDQQLAVFRTGHQWEDRVFRLWADRYPRRVSRQIRVKTTYGTGHIDLWVVPIKKIVEVKTTTKKMRVRLPLESHVDQLHMYQYWWGARRGATLELAYVIKETGEILSIPVPYDVARARSLVANLIAVQGAAQMTREPLPIPEEYSAFSYPCGWGEGRCAFWKHCWGPAAQEQDPKLGTILNAPQFSEDLAAYQRLQQRRSALTAQADVLKEEMEIYEDGFRRFLDDHQGQALRADRFRLRRTVVAPSITYDVKAAIQAGIVDPATLTPYRQERKGYTRWSLSERKTKTQEA